MGKDLYENFAAAKKVFDTADEVLGKKVTKICFEGPEEDLKQTINTQKKVFVAFLPQIIALRNRSFSNMQEYRLMVYKLIPIRFKPVLFRPYENGEQLIDFCAKYILNKPFISFDDYYEPNSIEESKKAKNVIYNNFTQGNRYGKKCFLLYGPKGCGKTLLLHALANHLGAKIAQIEGLELFKIPYFSREFVKACYGGMQFKPLIIYIKDMEKMIPNLNNFNFIYDKVASSIKANVYFVASTSVSVYQLPKVITSKFQFYQCIRPVDKNYKSEYVRFISNKIGIQINMNDKDLYDFSMNNLYNFSNEDIFDLIRNSIDIKKQRSPPDDENWVYREGLNCDELMNCLGTVNPSITTEVMKAYYL
jgi:cytidylate kinase